MSRTREIFDIIIDFPDSQPALEDLKVRLAALIQSAAVYKDCN